ncbi:uncharacterized protein [Porites lutea]|uniref:uncharacterized protein n=1 Tax=Porites lutea TaxID=51062 RepID=UPI003CC63A2B
MPEPNTMLYFKNYYKKLPVPFVVYADFECFTKPMNSCSPNPKDSYNYNYQKHEPSGFCFYVKGIVDKKIKPIIYTKTSEDEDISKVFVEKLAEVTKGIYNDFYQRPKPLRLTKEEQKSFEKAVNCHICSRELRNDKVRDHCHFTETQLPPKEEFYSQLYDEDISDDDYQHAIRVWNTFECKTIRDYHNLYLKSDVLLLSDVFENFRKTCLKHYKLDPAHYYTSPGLAWDACLKETGQQLELLHDYDMLMMFERGIRGGITHISKRYAEANNKYMKEFNPGKESTFIQYLDANNLYGWAMSQNLPTHGFKWMKNITKEKVMDIIEKANHSMSNLGSKGYIFEVDLEYPPHLWETHNDYPLAPEKIIVNGVEKLICHFKPRKNYVVHYRNLRQYLELEKYGNNAELLFTDTDSLMFQIKTKDFYKDISPDILTKFDTSDYPPNHESGIPTGANKKVIGMFKDEVAGKQITHFVGLRPKLYSFKIEEEREVRKCKGIKKNIVKKKIDFDDYVKCLISGEKEMRSMKIIRSEKHDIFSKEVNKVALSNEDDKRKVLEDNIHTLAFR